MCLDDKLCDCTCAEPEVRVLTVQGAASGERTLKDFLSSREASWRVEDAATPETAIAAGISGDHDVVLVESDLGGPISGLDVLRELRRGNARVILILLSSRAPDAADRLAAARVGADDHVARDERPEEIWLRIKLAQARRDNEPTASSSMALTFGPLTVDLCTTQVFIDGQTALEIRGRQYRLLTYLIERPERMIQWAELEKPVFGAQVSGGARNNAVFRLRSALGRAASFLITRPGACGLFLCELARGEQVASRKGCRSRFASRSLA